MASKPTSRFQPVPLSDSQISVSAMELLQKYAVARKVKIAPPIPVEDILEKHLKLTLELRDMEKLLGDPGILGATWIDQSLVRVDKELHKSSHGRYFFTLAHEVGHWQLHRPLILLDREIPELFAAKTEIPPPSFICRSVVKSPLERRIETQANKFAACLLMPEHMMKAAFRRMYPDGVQPPEQLCAEGKSEQQKDWLAPLAKELTAAGGFSNCSREAMRNRIYDLKLVSFSPNQRLF